jgi:pimeloyl-ACP methyl ester carboxylesterase
MFAGIKSDASFALQSTNMSCRGAATKDKEPIPPIAPIADKQLVGRFRDTPGIRIARVIFRWLSRVWPHGATMLGCYLLMRPPRIEERSWEVGLRIAARRVYRIAYTNETIQVYEWGEAHAPAILMVHGWGARATQMGRMIPALVSRGYRVVAFDAPAHGQSSGHTTNHIHFAGAVKAVADEVGEINSLIAHSFGVAATLLACRDWGVTAKRQIYISSFSHCIWFTEAFGKYLRIRADIVSCMRDMMVTRYSGRFVWSQLSVSDMLQDTNMSTLLIHDRNDNEIPYMHFQQLSSAKPQAETLTTNGLGHHYLLRNAEVINKVVKFICSDSIVATG